MNQIEIEKIKLIKHLCEELLLNHFLMADDVSSNGIDGGEQLTITKELIKKGMSDFNGLSKEQIMLLGERWPLRKGWMRRMLGKSISRTHYERFIFLRNAHLSN